MDLSIIIVNYNCKDKILNCLKSIFESDLGGLDFEAILVDNGSKESIGSEFNNLYPQVKIIESKKNLGMGGGNNLGIREARGSFILILNPDTIVQSGAIKKMREFLAGDESVGVVGPKLLYPDGQLQHSCFREWKLVTPLYRRTFLGKFSKKHLNNFLMADFDHNSAKEVDWLMGSCLMIRRSVLEKIKIFSEGVGHPIGCPTPCREKEEYFDERFFMYFEDADICRRARQAGFKVVYYPEAVVIHDHIRASAEKPWYVAPFINKLSRAHIASWIKYFWKWGV